jgi:Thioesterase-like superfamily
MTITKQDSMASAAYLALSARAFSATALTRGPWSPAHQHAGPPIALVCRAILQAASAHGLTHIARLTANLWRPIPVGDATDPSHALHLVVTNDYVGKNAGHFSAELVAHGKEVARFTALAQRECELSLPANLAGHPPPMAPASPEASAPCQFPFADGLPGYGELVEVRAARGRIFDGPCAIWFRLRHPLLDGEAPGPYERVAVAADSGNGISAILDYKRDVFVNSDLTINLLRRPVGEWICVDAKSWLGPMGSGLAESRLFDATGLIGRASQSLSIRLG